jgi:hypothetical protein
MENIKKFFQRWGTPSFPEMAKYETFQKWALPTQIFQRCRTLYFPEMEDIIVSRLNFGTGLILLP